MLEKLRLNNDFVIQSRDIDFTKKYFAFNLKTGSVFELNDTSYIMLKALADGNDVNIVIDQIASESSILSEIVQSDFNLLIKECIEIGVLEKQHD